MTTWTERDVERVVKLWNDGQSASYIQDMTGKSRSAILGKLFRLGLLNRRSGRDNAKRRRVTGNDGSMLLVPAHIRRKFGHITVANSSLPNPPERPHPPKAVSLLDLEAGQCRFPFGTGPYVFCGCQTVAGQSYCAEHYAIAFRRAEDTVPSQSGEREKINLKISKARKVLLEGVE